MKVKFDEIANFVAGQSPKSEFYSANEGIPFLQGNRTFGMFYPKIDTYTTKTTKIAHEGDILMSVRAPVGDLNFAPCELCIGRGLSAITAKNGDNAFLFYALKYNIQNLLNQSGGTTYDSVTGDVVRNMDMIIPEFSSHKKISELLYAIDGKIENNNKIISELESMAKTFYDYWFLQFEFPNEEGKPYKSSGGKMVWNEELKKDIPEGWETSTIEPFIEIVRGVSYKPADVSEHPKEGYVPLLKSNNLQNGKLLLDDVIYVPENLIDKNQYLSNNSLFVTMSSGSTEHVGKVALIPYDTPYSYGAFCSKIQINKKYRCFISSYFFSDFFKKYIHTIVIGTSIKNISNDHLMKNTVVLPPQRILQSFENNTNVIFDKLGEIIKENIELKNIRDFLLPMLMNGQITFKKEGESIA